MSKAPVMLLVTATVASVLIGWLPSSRLAEADSLGDPVAFALCTAEGAQAVEKCQAVGDPPAYQVPNRRRLIIEQVSGDCGGDGAPGEPLRMTIVAQTGGVVVEHAIIGIPRPPQPGGLIPLTRTRIYADAKSSVTIGLTEIPAFSGRFCRVAFSGLLVK